MLAPADAVTGTVDVVVSNGNGTSTAFQATLQDYSPALFLCGKHAMATVGTVKAAPADSRAPAWRRPPPVRAIL